MCKWPKRVNVPPTVLYFNVGEVYNLVYYTALWKDLIIQASIHMKIFAFMDEDILLIKMLNVASLVLPISNHFKKTCSSHISAIIKTYVGFYHHSGQRAISMVCRFPPPFWPKGHFNGWLDKEGSHFSFSQAAFAAICCLFLYSVNVNLPSAKCRETRKIRRILAIQSKSQN